MINEHLVQLRGKATIDRPLQSEKDYTIEGTFSVSETKYRPNGDGSDDVTYVLEPVIVFIKNEAGQSVVLKKKSSMSQAMRMAIIMWGRDNFPDMDDDEFYEKVMGLLIDRVPNLLTMLRKEIE